MSHAESHRELVTLPVLDVMSQPVLAVSARQPLGDALAVLVRTGLRHLAVVDDAERCVGVIADRAVAAAWAIDPAALEYVPVRRVLDPRPSVVGADATVGDVARLMHVDGVDAVAVIDRAGLPLGMVTGSDLVALMAGVVPPALAEDLAGHPDVAAEEGIESPAGQDQSPDARPQGDTVDM